MKKRLNSNFMISNGVNRKLSTLLGILIIAAVLHHFFRNSSGVIKPFAGVRLLKEIQINNFSSGAEIYLKKQGFDWSVIISTDYPADNRRVERLVGELKGLKFEAVIAFSENKRFSYGVSTAAAVKITVVPARGKSRTVYAGRPATDRQHFYAGFENDKRTFLATGMNSQLLTQNPEYYRNRKIVSISEDDVKSISILGMGKRYEVNKSTGGWQLEGAVLTDFYKVMNYCYNVRAEGFYYANFNKDIAIEIRKTDGETVKWELGYSGSSGEKALVAIPGRSGVYVIPTEKAEKIKTFLNKNGQK